MRRYRFYQLDVFTRTPLCGNPLAVFPEAAGLDPATMQALAREMNLSETTFVTASTKATRKVRFFTPTAEIPLAGHPTIGTWWLLAELGLVRLPAEGTVELTQDTGRGVLPVELEAAGGEVKRVVMTQPLPEWGSEVAEVDRLSQLLGSPPGGLVKEPSPQVVSTALPQLMVQVNSVETLEALPSGGTGADLAAFLRRYGTDCVMCFALDAGADDRRVRARMFAPGLGVTEDPATGSAAGALGCYLVRHGLVRLSGPAVRLEIHQGRAIRRPSEIEVEIACDAQGGIKNVRVGGTAVIVIEGEVRL